MMIKNSGDLERRIHSILSDNFEHLDLPCPEPVDIGLDVRVEDASNRGRIDMAVRHSGHVWLFEFKVVERTPAGGALQQIKDKGYAEKYRAEGLPIYMVGVEFSSVAGNVVGFEAELA